MTQCVYHKIFNKECANCTNLKAIDKWRNNNKIRVVKVNKYDEWFTKELSYAEKKKVFKMVCDISSGKRKLY
jgi:hypothetical protein